MNKLIKILSIIFGVILSFYSFSALFKIPYYEVIYNHGIKLRAIHIPLIFLTLIIISQILIHFFSKIKKATIIIVLTLCALYIITLYFYVTRIDNREYEKIVCSYFGCKTHNDNLLGIHECQVDKNMKHILIQFESDATDSSLDIIDSLKIVSVPDDYSFDNKSFDIKPVLEPADTANEYQVDISDIEKELFNHYFMDNVTLYTIVNDEYIFETARFYRDTPLTRFFARGDRAEMFDMFSTQSLLIISIIGLLLMFSFNLFIKTDVSEK